MMNSTPDAPEEQELDSFLARLHRTWVFHKAGRWLFLALGVLCGVFWILVVVHAVECAVFLPRLRAAGGSLANHLVQTFLFGIAHVSTLPGAEESRG